MAAAIHCHADAGIARVGSEDYFILCQFTASMAFLSM